MSGAIGLNTAGQRALTKRMESGPIVRLNDFDACSECRIVRKQTTSLTKVDLAELPAPFTRRDIEDYFDCSQRSAGYVVRRLLDEGEIKPAGRMNKPGRPTQRYVIDQDPIVDMQLRAALIPDDVLIAEVANRFLATQDKP
jgi:hypothetical protein